MVFRVKSRIGVGKRAWIAHMERSKLSVPKTSFSYGLNQTNYPPSGKLNVNVNGDRWSKKTSSILDASSLWLGGAKNWAFKCALCGWGYSNKSHPKVAEHNEDCLAIWIFEEWSPQTLADLKFVKSWIALWLYIIQGGVCLINFDLIESKILFKVPHFIYG